MQLYLDACVFVSLFTEDIWTRDATFVLKRHIGEIIVSDFIGLEFASALSRLVRMTLLREGDARIAFSQFDAWTARTAVRAETVSADITAAEAILRRLDLPLRTGDALNIAIADRLGATLATFDQKMAKAARALGVGVVGDHPAAG